MIATEPAGATLEAKVVGDAELRVAKTPQPGRGCGHSSLTYELLIEAPSSSDSETT